MGIGDLTHAEPTTCTSNQPDVPPKAVNRSRDAVARSPANPDRPGAGFLYLRLHPGGGVVRPGSGPGRCLGAGLRLLPARESILPTQEPARQLAGGLDEDLKVEGDRVLADVKKVERPPLLARQPPAPQPPQPGQARAHRAQVREPRLMRPDPVE